MTGTKISLNTKTFNSSK